MRIKNALRPALLVANPSPARRLEPAIATSPSYDCFVPRESTGRHTNRVRYEQSQCMLASLIPSRDLVRKWGHVTRESQPAIAHSLSIAPQIMPCKNRCNMPTRWGGTLAFTRYSDRTALPLNSAKCRLLAPTPTASSDNRDKKQKSSAHDTEVKTVPSSLKARIRRSLLLYDFSKLL